jgi:hypothetical protein
LDRSDFDLHEAHKKKESKDPASNKKVQDKGKKRKEPSKSQTDDAEHGVRRSARQLGIKAEISADAESHIQDLDGTPHKHERALKDLSASLAEHANAEREHLRWAGHIVLADLCSLVCVQNLIHQSRISTAGQQRPATIVGTASYQHTLHRVRTMTEKALALRIKAIERGAPRTPITHTVLSLLHLLPAPDAARRQPRASSPSSRCASSLASSASKAWRCAAPTPRGPRRDKVTMPRAAGPEI